VKKPSTTTIRRITKSHEGRLTIGLNLGRSIELLLCAQRIWGCSSGSESCDQPGSHKEDV
jgi:hypothetical protein